MKYYLQTESIDLAEEKSKSERASRVFRRSNLDKKSHAFIDSDGLPYVGQVCQSTLNFSVFC